MVGDTWNAECEGAKYVKMTVSCSCVLLMSWVASSPQDEEGHGNPWVQLSGRVLSCSPKSKWSKSCSRSEDVNAHFLLTVMFPCIFFILFKVCVTIRCMGAFQTSLKFSSSVLQMPEICPNWMWIKMMAHENNIKLRVSGVGLMGHLWNLQKLRYNWRCELQVREEDKSIEWPRVLHPVTLPNNYWQVSSPFWIPVITFATSTQLPRFPEPSFHAWTQLLSTPDPGCYL